MAINYQKIYDHLNYEEGIEFRDLAIEVIQEIYPHYRVKPVEPQNPDSIYITNQEDNVRLQVPMRELYTRFANTTRTKNGFKEMILDAYAQMFSQIEDSDYFLNREDPTWAEARDFIQPRLERIDRFSEGVESYIHFPFGEELVTCLVIDHPDEGTDWRVSNEMLEKWNVTVDEAYKKAMENFADLTDGMSIVGSGKPHAYLWNEKGEGYAASALLLGGMRHLIAQTIGSPFRFGIPSKHAFYCWTEFDDAEFQVEARAFIKRQFDSMPGCLTTNIYEVDEHGNIKQLKNQPEVPDTPMFSKN